MIVTYADELNMPKSPSHVLIHEHDKMSGKTVEKGEKGIPP